MPLCEFCWGGFFLKIYSVKDIVDRSYDASLFFFHLGTLLWHWAPQSINISLIALLKLQCLRFDGIEWEVAAFTDYFLDIPNILLWGGRMDKFGPWFFNDTLWQMMPSSSYYLILTSVRVSKKYKTWQKLTPKFVQCTLACLSKKLSCFVWITTGSDSL